MPQDDLSLNVVPSPADGEAHATDGSDSLMIADTIVSKALKLIEGSRTVVEAWRKQAQEADRFQASKQYSNEDRQILDHAKRPSAVFNAAQKFIRVVSGLERRSREALEFIPAEMSELPQAQLGELVTKAYQWVLKQCQGDDERSDVFEKKLIRGMGWGEVRLDTSIDPNGMIMSEAVDGYEMLWDQNARHSNVTDRMWDARVKLVPYEVCVARWPDKKSIFDTLVGIGGPGSPKPQQYDLFNWLVSMAQITGRSDKGDVLGGQGSKHMVPLVDFEWYDEVAGYYFFDPIDQKDDWLSNKDFTKYEARLAKAKLPSIEDYTKQLKRHYQRFIFAGHFRITDPIDLPGNRFIRNCMTGMWDDDDRLFYGFMRIMMDPQRFMNAFWNQALEIMRVQSKAGLFAETGALVNARDAEEKYAKTGSIVLLKDGGIAKIKEKSLPQMPAASAQMMQIASNMLQEVTGVSPDVLGLSGGEESGVTMGQRQMANIALLASEFAALRRYRIDEAYTIFDFFKFISDGRMVRIGGQFDGQQSIIQLMRDPFNIKYDIILEESDHDPNVKQRYRDSIMQLAPTLIRTNNFMPELLDYMDLPRRLIEAIKQGMKKQAQVQMQMAQMGIKPGGRGQKDPRETQAKITKLGADTVLQIAKAEKVKADAKHSKVGIVLNAIMDQQKHNLERDRANFDAIQGQNQLAPNTLT